MELDLEFFTFGICLMIGINSVHSTNKETN